MPCLIYTLKYCTIYKQRRHLASKPYLRHKVGDGKNREHRKYEGLIPFLRCGSGDGTRRRCEIVSPTNGAVEKQQQQKTKKREKKATAPHAVFIFLCSISMLYVLFLCSILCRRLYRCRAATVPLPHGMDGMTSLHLRKFYLQISVLVRLLFTVRRYGTTVG